MNIVTKYSSLAQKSGLRMLIAKYRLILEVILVKRM